MFYLNNSNLKKKMKFKLLYYILLLLPILLVSCSSFYWNRPVPYQEAITTQDQRLFKEKNSDTVLLVLVRDKSLETNSNLLLSLFYEWNMHQYSFSLSRTAYNSTRISFNPSITIITIFFISVNSFNNKRIIFQRF